MEKQNVKLKSTILQKLTQFFQKDCYIVKGNYFSSTLNFLTFQMIKKSVPKNEIGVFSKRLPQVPIKASLFDQNSENENEEAILSFCKTPVPKMMQSARRQTVT